jgi:hypothetical protein
MSVANAKISGFNLSFFACLEIESGRFTGYEMNLKVKSGNTIRKTYSIWNY